MTGTAAGRAARRAEALGHRLPALLVAAERVAATVAQGVHGRRRVGPGESFWQFRPFLAGDPASRIDWRQSARSDRAYVRETEWAAAQTVVLWRDGGPGMHYRSERAPGSVFDRAGLLTLALASLLLRGGERVRLLAPAARTVSGRGGLERLAEELARLPAGDGLPPEVTLPRHARVVLISDLLGPLEGIQAVLSRLAAVPASGHVLQVLDPNVVLFPFKGNVLFEGMQREAPTRLGCAEEKQAAYAQLLARHQAGLAAICAAAGFGFATHRTDRPPEAALLGLYQALAPAAHGARA